MFSLKIEDDTLNERIVIEIVEVLDACFVFNHSFRALIIKTNIL